MPNQHNATILLVDDTPENLQLLIDLLRQEGYKVRAAPNGELALATVRRDPPDLILLDIWMPGMDGYEVCAQLKADEHTRDIPVLFVSALNQLTDKMKGFEAGGLDYISKPFQAEEVLARVTTHLKLRRLQRELEANNAQLQQEIDRRIEVEEEMRTLNEQLRKANQQLEAINQELHEANASKDKFFSIIAHDLRSPFTGLIGLTEALIENLEAYSVDRLKSLLGRIHVSSERTYALLTNLLTWSRLERGHIEFQPGKCPLRDLAEKNVRLLASNFELKRIAIQNQIPYSITAYADAQMTDTVLRNLLSNALKFTQPGGSIDISAQEYENEVELIVADTGIGMEQKTIDALFHIDIKSSTPGTAGEQGSGLGLILCKELLEKHGGALRVRSEVGKGSVFTVSLPATPEKG